ncbi:Peroxisomal targeting signal 1 receptor [Sciurus carolinensis]|uniref:Peroxisomal targeting signal 1 receptor n=1 Tax=Sciurus carolinensis TaxID=30640 RepID=A0AA41N2T0_SCICA|nr:Peroxisomal targeting signal 1 receptor [Sciurus carolinensis]
MVADGSEQGEVRVTFSHLFTLLRTPRSDARFPPAGRMSHAGMAASDGTSQRSSFRDQETQAGDEQGLSAIHALRRSLELKPGNRSAPMLLAGRFSSESRGDGPVECARLAGFHTSMPIQGSLAKKGRVGQDQAQQARLGVSAAWLLFLEVRALPAAVRLAPTPVDPAVQCGSGVLCNLRGSMTGPWAVSQLFVPATSYCGISWGTLANGNQSDEAAVGTAGPLSGVKGLLAAGLR